MSGALSLVLPVLTAAFAAVAGWRLVRRLEAENRADWGHPWLNRIDGLNRWFCRRYHNLRAQPLPLPEHGPALVVANHVSGLDPLLLIAASRRPLRFIIAAEQYHRPVLNRLFRAGRCIPVDRSGRPERAFREALRALAAGEVVALFPHGAIHLESDPPRPLKSGVAKLAQLAGCPVYAARISGVRGAGKTVRAVLFRSQASVESFPPIPCQALDTSRCLESIAARIDGRHRHCSSTEGKITDT